MNDLDLTPSQYKLLLDQEMWMKDVGAKYTRERTRMDAADDIRKRFPTEQLAKDALDEWGGDPVLYKIYDKKSIEYAKYMNKERSKKKTKPPTRKCKCSK
jgi:hypothetical protein